MTRRVLGAALAITVGVGATACSPAEDMLGLRGNTTPPATQPVVAPGTATAVAERALARAERADATQTPAAAREAFTGLALRLAAPSYRRSGDRDSSGSALRLTEAPQVVVTAGSTWPRTVLSVHRADPGSPTELAVLQSRNARTPYQVAARVELLAGAALPPSVAADRGAEILTADAAGLVATPRRAVADYARLLQTGRSGGTVFASDPVVPSVRNNASSQAADVRAVAAFAQEHRPERDVVSAVRTADGGALVVAAIDRVDRFRVRKGAGTITPPSTYAGLARGAQRITRQADVTTVQVLALVLPPAGRGPARVVGFSEQPVTFSAS
jgi:hypothetical protein